MCIHWRSAWMASEWPPAASTRYVNFAKCLAFSPKEKRLAVAYGNGAIKLWDVATGAESLTMKWKSNSVQCLAFSPDGARLGLADAQPNQAVMMWDVTSNNVW